MIKYFLDKSADPKIDLRLERRSAGASGYDLMANLGLSRDLEPGQRWNVPTGLYLEMPLGLEAQIRTRSGLARDHGVIVLSAPGTIDSDYRGEIQVTLINLGQSRFSIIPGERIAQIVFCPVFATFEHVGAVSSSGFENLGEGLEHRGGHVVLRSVWSRDELSHTTRGASGFGSTGR